MIHHPLLVGIGTIDGVAVILLLIASVSAVQVLIRWNPESAERSQLQLEARFDVTSFLVRVAIALLLAGTLLWLVAVTLVLVELVPGAMCGTGVINATRGRGGRALALRAVALAVLGAWHLIDRLDRTEPRSPLALGSSRALLLGVPLVVLATVETLGALLSLNTYEAVSCCAVVYDAAKPATLGMKLGTTYWVWLTLAGGLLCIALGLGLWRGRSGWHRALSRAAAPVALVWVLGAAIALTRTFASYHYEVLHHRCPWCLFLPEHGCVGFVSFGALAWAALEGLAAWLALAMAARAPAVAEAAEARSRTAGWRLALAVMIYGVVAAAPAIVYRLKFGTWLDGTV